MPLRDDSQHYGHETFEWEQKQDRLYYENEERIQRARFDVYRNPEDETAAKPEKRENIHEEQ